MDVADLVFRHPRLYHMAAGGSWQSIRRLGLLPAATLVDTWSVPSSTRAALLQRPRPASTTLQHPRRGSVVIRDQAPLRERHLRACLDADMQVRDWLALLNGMVFFWPDVDRLERLLSARRFRGDAHDVLVVDTGSLVATHGSAMRLCAINSGATLYPNAPPRGRSTFATIADYDYWDIRRRRGPRQALAEVTVVGGVPDILRHTVRVERRHGSALVETVFEAARSSGLARRAGPVTRS